MQYDLDEVKKYLTLLTGEADPVVHWQMYFDVKGEPAPKGLQQDFAGRLMPNLDLFLWKQERFCGVYVTVNITDGGRKKKDVVGYRHCIADWDGMRQPVWPLLPSIQTKRDETHGHTYFRVTGVRDNDHWTLLQKRIVMCCGTDPQILDPCRVLRVAGFIHHKDRHSPQMYRVYESNDVTYTAEQIEAAFVLNGPQEEALELWKETRQGILDGTGLESNPRYSAMFLKWARDRAAPAMAGAGSGELYRVACYGKDIGIPLQEAQDVLWEYYNPRCGPPWEEEEKDNGDANDFYQIVERAYLNSISIAGCKTMLAKFTAHRINNPLPPRSDGWESKAEIASKISPEQAEEAVKTGSFGRIQHDEGASRMSSADNKTPDYCLAVIFDALIFNGKEIVRCDKIYYEFVGDVYKVVSDDVIKSKIQRLIAHHEPPNKRVQGIFLCHEPLVNIPEVMNGMWFTKDDRDPKNLSVYNNCIVDVSTTPPTTFPHTHDYFTFNKRDYDYDADALCPVMDAFLHSCFPNDPDCVTLVYEWIGYNLTLENKFQKCMMLIGKSRAGKGVLVNTMRKVIGMNSTSAPPLNTLHTDHVLHNIHDKASIFIGDMRTPKDPELAVSTLLQITGNDWFTYNIKFKPAQTSPIGARVTMSANEMPNFVDASGALTKRMLILKFTETFYGKEDFELANKLEKELAGIAVKSTYAYKAMTARGTFTEPKSSIIERQEIHDELFKLSSFVHDMCDTSTDAITFSDELYKYYQMHCGITGVRMPMTQIKFNKTLKSSDLPITMVRKVKNGFKMNAFIGIKIQPRVKTDLENTMHPQFKKGNQ